MYSNSLLVLLSFQAMIACGCRVFPSEYAFLTSSLQTNELFTVNCRSYSEDSSKEGNPVQPTFYTHCDGTQLRLTDSDLGSEQYNSNDYYVWPAGSSGSDLLFIFPTRVNLTTITLHYYSDNLRGLPRLRFYAVPDDFDVWDALSVSYSHVDIPAAAPPDGRPAGRWNVSISLHLYGKKILLYKDGSSYAFAVNEVEFFTCNESITTTTERILPTSYSVTIATVPFPGDDYIDHNTKSTSEIFTMPSSKNSSATTTTVILKSLTMPASELTNSRAITTTIIGVVTAILLLLLLTIATISLFILRRKFAKRTVEYESTYSTLCREVQQVHPQSVLTSNELYDQIQLSPSTGQAEFISRNETANTNNSPPHQTEYDIHPSVDKDKPKSGKLKIAASTISSQKENKNTLSPEHPTYAVVNKRKQKKSDIKESKNSQSQNTAPQTQDVMEKSTVKQGHKIKDDFEADTNLKLASQTVESPQDLYSVVKKKPKERLVKDDNPPPIPKYTVEELYTDVKEAKKMNSEEAAPQIPPHTIDELYTAVQKKPKANESKDEEEAPPIPAHTVEELYTAVMKKLKIKYNKR